MIHLSTICFGGSLFPFFMSNFKCPDLFHNECRCKEFTTATSVTVIVSILKQEPFYTHRLKGTQHYIPKDVIPLIASFLSTYQSIYPFADSILTFHTAYVLLPQKWLSLKRRPIRRTRLQGA